MNSTERALQRWPRRSRLGRRRRTKCCSQGILRQLTDDRTPLVHHTLIQSARKRQQPHHCEPTGSLKHWVSGLQGGPRTGHPAKLPHPIPHLKNPLECLRRDRAVPSLRRDLSWEQEVQTSFVFVQFRGVRRTLSVRGSLTVPARLLTGMYQEWKVAEHKWPKKTSSRSRAQRD